jgi:hypothetical protein
MSGEDRQQARALGCLTSSDVFRRYLNLKPASNTFEIFSTSMA